jgi:hypothetical protein
MAFEIAGFVSGVAGIALALWVLYRRDSSRVVQGIYGQARRKQQA